MSNAIRVIIYLCAIIVCSLFRHVPGAIGLMAGIGFIIGRTWKDRYNAKV